MRNEGMTARATHSSTARLLVVIVATDGPARRRRNRWTAGPSCSAATGIPAVMLRDRASSTVMLFVEIGA
jgi:hypothetical protein